MDVEFVGSGMVCVPHVKHTGPGLIGTVIAGHHHFNIIVNANHVQEDVLHVGGLIQILVIIVKLHTVKVAIHAIVFQPNSLTLMVTVRIAALTLQLAQRQLDERQLANIPLL